MSGLMRFAKLYSLLSTSVGAGFLSPEIDISKVEFIGIYVKSNVNNTFVLQVKTGDGYLDYDSLQVSAGVPNFWNIWSLPFDKIRIKVTSAATVSIEVTVKT